MTSRRFTPLQHDLLKRLAQACQEYLGDGRALKEVFLTPRGECVPEIYLGEDINGSIANLFHTWYRPICDLVEERTGIAVSIHVDPSYEDSSVIIITGRQRLDFDTEALLLRHWWKAWNVHWDSIEDLAAEMVRTYKHLLDHAKAVVAVQESEAACILQELLEAAEEGGMGIEERTQGALRKAIEALRRRPGSAALPATFADRLEVIQALLAWSMGEIGVCDLPQVDEERSALEFAIQSIQTMEALRGRVLQIEDDGYAPVLAGVDPDGPTTAEGLLYYDDGDEFTAIIVRDKIDDI
jgi:hypothetical protein